MPLVIDRLSKRRQFALSSVTGPEAALHPCALEASARQFYYGNVTAKLSMRRLKISLSFPDLGDLHGASR